MYLKNIFLGLLILVSVSLFAEKQSITPKKDKKNLSVDSVQLSLDYLKKYIRPSDV
jgi:hypothetical protein